MALSPPRRGPTRPGEPAEDPEEFDDAGLGGRFGLGGASHRSRRVMRWLVGTVLLLLVVNGALRMVERSSVPTAEEVAALAAAKLGHTGFPVTAAEAFADRFAMVYLTWDANAAEIRKQVLAGYASDQALQQGGAQLGWDGTGRQTAYIAMPAGTRVVDDHHAVVTVTVLTDDGLWKYLAVPVYADGSGGFAVTGRPAYTQPPAKASPPDTAAAPPSPDSAATAELRKSLPAFLSAYAASKADNLAYLVPGGGRLHGLEGAVTFASLKSVSVPTGGDRRQAAATVVWAVRTPSGRAQLTQAYTLTIVRVEGRWLFERVEVATA